MSKQLTEIQKRTLDGALIVAGWGSSVARERTIADLEPVLADMLSMAYEKGVEDAVQATQKPGAIPEGLG